MIICILLTFSSSVPREPAPVPMQMLDLNFYNQAKESYQKQKNPAAFVIYLANTTRGDKNDLTGLFQEGAELAAAFVSGIYNSIHFGVCFDHNIKFSRVECSFPGAPDGYFRIRPDMIPAQISTKIIHLAARTMKAARRNAKEEKNPGIGRIKNELRSIHKNLKMCADEEARNNLEQSRQNMIQELLEALPEEKRAIRLLKLENKEKIADKIARQKSNEAVQKMKKDLKIEKNTEKDNSYHKKFKKVIDILRKSWRESKEEESQYNYEEELERQRFRRQREIEEMEDDSEEVEQLFTLLHTVKNIAGPNEDLGDIDKRYEIIKKVREKRHERQKREGNYRPRDENGEYLFDDSKIRTHVDDVQSIGLEEVDLSPIKNEKEETERKRKEVSKDKRPPEIPEEIIEGQYEGL